MQSTRAGDFEELIASIARAARDRAIPFTVVGVFAGRPRDLEDAVGIVRRKGQELDWGYISEWAGQFAAVPGREALPGQVLELRQHIRTD